MRIVQEYFKKIKKINMEIHLDSYLQGMILKMKMVMMGLDQKIKAIQRKRIKINQTIVFNKIRIDHQLSKTAANNFKNDYMNN